MPMLTNITILILIFIIAEYILDWYLDKINANSWEKPIPKLLEGIYDEEKYLKAQAYNKEKKKLGRWTTLLSTTIMIAMLLFGGFAILQEFVSGITANTILQALLYFGIIALVSDIISTPISLYNTFVVEEKYGFNKTTLTTFFLDKIKGGLMGAIIGGLILSGIIYFYLLTEQYFWIYAWLLLTVFSLFMAAFYTSLIVPIFNKLTPLEEGSLRTKIEDFALKAGFPVKNISVIDGSKRSTKANAYFSGMGPVKSIVLYDTLIKDHTEEELASILAHEIGHYKLKHIRQGIAISIINTGILMFLLSLCVNQIEFSQALGVNTKIFHIGLITFSMLYSPISMATGILSNIVSRKNEYEADAFAKKHTGGQPLIDALKKLNSNQLSNLNPHPLYVFFHYSHPSLLQRVEKLI